MAIGGIRCCDDDGQCDCDSADWASATLADFTGVHTIRSVELTKAHIVSTMAAQAGNLWAYEVIDAAFRPVDMATGGE